MRRTTRAALTLAATAALAAGLAATAAAPALASYPRPSIHLLCSAAANSGTLQGNLCVLPSGQTTAPNSYSATIAVSKAGAAGPTVTFALTAGSLPPGLTMPSQSGSGSGSGTVITGNPTRAGTFNFTVKATDGNLTSTLAYQITVTVQGPPDQLLCNRADNSFLIGGTCVLPNAVIPLATGTVGVPYSRDLIAQGGARPYSWFVVTTINELPPGLTLGTTAPDFNNVLTGTPTQAGTFTFPMQVQDSQNNLASGTVTITINP